MRDLLEEAKRLSIEDQIDELLSLAWRDPKAAGRKKAELVERLEQAERQLVEAKAQTYCQICGRELEAPEHWVCEHGVTYSGSPDFISGARNAHLELERHKWSR